MSQNGRTHASTEELLYRAKQILPKLGYGALVPTLIPILGRNITLGRLDHYLKQSPNRSLESYLHRLARTHEAEAEHIQALKNGGTETQVSLWRDLDNRAFRRLLRCGVPSRQAYEWANDAAQDAWRAIITGKAIYPFDIDFVPWSTVVLYHQFKKKKGDLLDQDETDWLDSELAGLHDIIPDPTAGDAIREFELAQVVEQALLFLTGRKQRQAIILCLEGLSTREAAYKAGCSYKVMKSRRRHGRDSIRRFLSLSNLDSSDLLCPDQTRDLPRVDQGATATNNR